MHSVEEAIQTQSMREAANHNSQRAIMKRFFQPKSAKAYAPPVTKSSPITPATHAKSQRKSRKVKSQPHQTPFRPRCRTQFPLNTPTEDAALFQPVVHIKHSPGRPAKLDASLTQDSQLLASPCLKDLRKLRRSIPSARTNRSQPKITSNHSNRSTTTRRRSVLCVKDCLQRKLTACGFILKIPKRQADSDAVKRDYSGSLVSTTP